METIEEGTERGKTEILFEEKDYGDIGITYEFLDSTGHKWIQQNVAELMLGVGYKSVERYCKELNVKRERHRTKRYSYNFIREHDVEAIAAHFDKALKRPWNDIPHTDDNKKVLSKTDAQFLAEQHMSQAVANFQTQIGKLENRNDKLEARNDTLREQNDKLNNDLKNVATETMKIQGREKNWLLIFILCLAFIGGGSFFVWNSHKELENKKAQVSKKNTSLSKEVQQKTQAITSKNMEIRTLENKLKDQEIEFLKTRAEEKRLEKFNVLSDFKLEGGILK